MRRSFLSAVAALALAFTVALPAFAQDVEDAGTPQGDGVASAAKCTVSDLDVFVTAAGNMQGSAFLHCGKMDNGTRTVTLEIVDANTAYSYVKNEWHPNKGSRKDETIFTAEVTSCAPGGSTLVQLVAFVKKDGHGSDKEISPVFNVPVHGCT